MSPVEELETGSIIDLLQAEKRYKEEREKRLRPDTKDQFIDICLDDRFKTFLEDPWIDMDGSAVKDASTMFPNNRCQLLIVGAGWGGILYAIRMIQAGIDADGIRIVDIAGGFGGTWYWNRYPGLTCDTESYSYLPLLEETGYIPQHRYSSGEEIRNYAKLVAQKWGLKDKSIFQTKAEKLNWDEHLKQWRVALVQQREAKEPLKLEVYAQFVAAVNGVLNWPKLPAIPGIFDYRGNLFHSSRWDYDVTGGSPTDPSLSKLQEQRVAIIGTGGTAIQSIPYLARWAKHLYVVQRTPSGVDERNQRETSTEWFRNEVAKVPGWQRERLRNFHQHFTTEEPPAINLIDDGWSRARGMAVVAGNPNGPRKMEELPAYIKKVYAIDLPRQERIRKRVGEVVKDPILAKRLQAWYPTWCKRPTWNDEYLSTFNRDNVTLIDTDGKGLDGITENSIVSGSETYPVDIIIFATGYRALFAGSPAEKANMTVIGRNGVSMSEEWARSGPSTLHGIIDANFPNLFLCGPWQASFGPNYLFSMDTFAHHSGYIIAEARRKAGGRPFSVAPTYSAAESWGTQILQNSLPLTPLSGCTLGYFNGEGSLLEMPMIKARSGIWGRGIEDFVGILDAWREEGSMDGMEVQT